jgi:hypothetical protein
MKEFIKMLIGSFIACCIYAAYDHYRDEKAIGLSISYIKYAKADCEKSGKECVMLWDFVEVEADYE